MIQKIIGNINYGSTQNINLKIKNNKNTNPIITTTKQNTAFLGIPHGYINFKGNSELTNNTSNDNNSREKLTPAASRILSIANAIKNQNKDEEINAYHILDASLFELNEFLSNIQQYSKQTIPSIISLANNYASLNILENPRDFNLFLNEIEKFENNVFNKINSKTKQSSKINLDNILKDVNNKKDQETISNTDLLVGAMNVLTYSGEVFPTQFLHNLNLSKLQLSKEEIKENHLKNYDANAIDIWNKLAIGNNLFITYNNPKEEKYITSSIIKTINAPKHGNVNNKNTAIYAMNEDINGENLTSFMETKIKQEPNKKQIFLINLTHLLVNSREEDEENYSFKPDILKALEMGEDENIKLILFQDKDSYYTNLQNPAIKNLFSEFIEYSIPPMHTYEAIDIIIKNKKLLNEISIPFTKEAKIKAITLADKIEGIYPDKAIDYMKRIANYYKDEKSKITIKEVNEFAIIAKDLFNKSKDSFDVIYDTGKNLNDLIGKETTKKDAEAIVRQIRSGKLGTKGLIVYSEDEIAGSGRRFTAQAIAGEARIPFIEIDSSEFGRDVEDSDGDKISPKQAIKKVFTNAKNAAEQNPSKTALIYVNNFEDLVFSGPYLAGYKEAMSQLEKEMSIAEKNNLNLLIVGSTDEYYAPIIPAVAKNFNQNLIISSPATNKQARKDIIENYIENREIPIAYKNYTEKENLINKLVKLTEYMSFVEIKSMLDKAQQIMLERNKTKAEIGEFIESYLQLCAGRTSHPEMPEYNKEATTSHECGHATNLEVMGNILRAKGKPWHQSRNVNFITLDPRGNFLGAVFEGRSENSDYPFEALFTDLVCSYGGYSCEKRFFDMDGSTGITQDLAQASSAAKRAVEYFGMGYNTGKISNAAKIQSGNYNENVFKDMNVILKNAQYVSDLITEVYSDFNKQFTNKYAKLIGTNDCMVDGDDFRALLAKWIKSQPENIQEEINILEDMVMDVIAETKKGNIYGKVNNIENGAAKNIINLTIENNKDIHKEIEALLSKIKI